ncbi:hypothetical protein [Spongiimicrobium salis]|uniref:hypothetical protein n=1 Tax=Spongiimicrobium salis TaxID=1667022 RepID=UPI00374CAC90
MNKPKKIDIRRISELDLPTIQYDVNKINNLLYDYRISIAEMQEEFFHKLSVHCLGREPDLIKDKGRFTIISHTFNDHSFLEFDGKVVGEIRYPHQNMNPQDPAINLVMEFIPIEK